MNIYFDGGCQPNPGQMEVCFIVPEQPGYDRFVFHERVSRGTNNQAEWLALVCAATHADQAGMDDLAGQHLEVLQSRR